MRKSDSDDVRQLEQRSGRRSPPCTSRPLHRLHFFPPPRDPNRQVVYVQCLAKPCSSPRCLDEFALVRLFALPRAAVQRVRRCTTFLERLTVQPRIIALARGKGRPAALLPIKADLLDRSLVSCFFLSFSSSCYPFLTSLSTLVTLPHPPVMARRITRSKKASLKAAALAAVACASTVSAQTYRRAAACPSLGCVYPPYVPRFLFQTFVLTFPPLCSDQTEFIAGQVFDIRIESHAPLNGTQAYKNGVVADDFALYLRGKGATELKEISQFYNIEQPKVESYNFTVRRCLSLYSAVSRF